MILQNLSNSLFEKCLLNSQFFEELIIPNQKSKTLISIGKYETLKVASNKWLLVFPFAQVRQVLVFLCIWFYGFYKIFFIFFS